jgi:hypothetical protein
VATLLAITVDRYLYIVKPLKYLLIVTMQRRGFLAISGIWMTACCLLTVLLIYAGIYDFRLRSLCVINDYIRRFMDIFVSYLPLTLILIHNIRILIVAEKQRKRISWLKQWYSSQLPTDNLQIKYLPYMDFFTLLKQLKHCTTSTEVCNVLVLPLLTTSQIVVLSMYFQQSLSGVRRSLIIRMKSQGPSFVP